MSTGAIVLIIGLVIGIIVGNLLLLRRSTRFTFKKPKEQIGKGDKEKSEEKNKHRYKNSYDDEDDDW